MDTPPAASTPCVVCGSNQSTDLGRIVHARPEKVAGVPIDLDGVEFRLRGCPNCGFQYKVPPIPPKKLLGCYQAAAASHWQERPNPRKRRFDTLQAVIEAHARGRRALDVGCFNGALLEYLGDGWQRFGIEPSVEAATLAGQRGVTILGPTVDSLLSSGETFDVVLAIDVIEHVDEPMHLFREVRKCLGPGGVVVLATGDTASWPWRLHGSRYWYCSLPEHVSFYCRRTFDFIAKEIGMQPLESRRLSHQRSDAYHRARQAISNLWYASARRTGGFGVASYKRRLDERAAPGWLTARDHLLYVMQVP